MYKISFKNLSLEKKITPLHRHTSRVSRKTDDFSFDIKFP